MDKKILPAGQGLPFSKAIVCSQKYTMEISGQIGLNSAGKLEQGIQLQTKQAFQNVKEILNEVGWDFENLAKVRIFLEDMKNYQIVNEIYSEYFKKDFPSRVALGVRELPLGALIELDCTASGENIK